MAKWLKLQINNDDQNQKTTETKKATKRYQFEPQKLNTKKYLFKRHLL